jgi:protein-S-isoprenylcysteine O-methyltransferase Ste14
MRRKPTSTRIHSPILSAFWFVELVAGPDKTCTGRSPVPIPFLQRLFRRSETALPQIQPYKGTECEMPSLGSFAPLEIFPRFSGAAPGGPFLLLQFVVIIPEEKYLESSFGEEYIHYRLRVRRWL